MVIRRRFVAVLLFGLCGITVLRAQTPDIYAPLKFRYIGPVGNRVIAVTGVPRDPNVYYVGAASGGIFKTSDNGAHWDAIFDDQSVSSIGSLAVAPSDPNVIWAGTGEAFIRSNISIGNGIYRSTDAGRTWVHKGLEQTGRIGRVVVDPANADVALACALGHAYGPQQERGVYRTADGGQTWQHTLFVDENTGCSDIAIDPHNSRVLFAGMWQIEIHTWGRNSGGPGSGLFKSVDGGLTWQRLTGHGLPHAPLGKISAQVAPGNSRRVYALIETGDGLPAADGTPTQSGSLWRSDDGGEQWELISSDRRLRGRTHYYTRFAIEPDNENEAYFLSAEFTKTLDGGRTSVELSGRVAPTGDNHDMWIDPTNGDRFVVAHDDGLSFSVNRGRSWRQVQLPVAQMYHVAVDNQIPYNVYGNRQDGPSTRGPSNSRLAKQSEEDVSGPIPRGMWHSVAGGESGWAIPDPVDSNIVWASGTGFGSLGGTVERFDERTRQAREVEIWPETTVGTAAGELKYRFNWTFPVAISPHDHNTVYAGSQFVHRTTDAGQTWQAISPDLTLNDRSHQQRSGGLTPDNVGVEYAGVVFAIAESPREKGVVWAGTNDGQLQISRDAGGRWTNVTANIPGLPPLGTVSNIEPSRFDNGTAYVTFDLHQVNNRDPFIFKTADYGRTWRSVAGDIPKSLHSYAHCVREDPVRRGMLYLGTENALYFSLDDGQRWQALQSGLPHAPVHWLTVQEHFNDLVVATYGRGFWILDDITPLRAMTPEALTERAHLFEPRPAYRFKPITDPMMMPDDATEGRNPPYGAAITFSLKSAPIEAARAKTKIVISGPDGAVVRTLEVGKDAVAGLNRVWWDLRMDPSDEIFLRTKPLYAAEYALGPDGTRKFPTAAAVSVLVPPGTYTVKLVADDLERTALLSVRKDPNTAGSDEDIAAQTKVMLSVRRNASAIAKMINTAESIRAQLVAWRAMTKGDAGAAEAIAAADQLEKEIVDLESRWLNLTATGRGQDFLRTPSQMIDKLTHLADVVSYADFSPTESQTQVDAKLSQEVAHDREQLDGVVARPLATFNALLRQRQLGAIIGPKP
ncbi:MAG: glycosyl hydrolase, repeat-containing protein [Acidobacteria bacterium]|nr:glycosyl hydrolase, repeat-containing protein [Acidobacteriota bacterium]